MHFGNPTAFWAFALLPLLAAAGWMALRRRARVAERLGESAFIDRLHDASTASWRRSRVLIALVALALLSFAAARPQYGRVEQTISRAGVDIIVAIDTSASMLATDVKPSRLAKAKESLERLVRRFKGNRVGIVAFAGDALLVCPMTLDFSLASLVLQSVDPYTIGRPGTDLGLAIDESTKAFDRGGSGSRVLVLLTDGEDNEAKGLAAAERAAKSGTKIFAIGIGTERGAPIPDSEIGYKEDDKGSKVVSKMDLGGLGAIANISGGAAYTGGDNPNIAVNRIALRIDNMLKSEIESHRVIIYQDRYAWFVAPAMALIAWLLVSRPRQLRRVESIIMDEANAI